MKLKLILGALGLAFVVATCSSTKAQPIGEWRDDATSRVTQVMEDAVTDPARRERALAAARKLSVADAEFASALESTIDKLHELHRNYDSTRQDFDVWAEQFARTRALYRGRSSANFDALKGALTDDEWAVVWTAYEAEFEAFERLYQ